MKPTILAAAALVACASAGAAEPVPPAAGAGEGARWRIVASPHTEHYGRSEDHRHVWLLGVERESAGGWVTGAGYFRNSFGQPTWYFYPFGGVYRRLFGVEPLFFKWSAGAAYGYKSPYEDKVPINWNNIVPVIVPAIGWDFTRRFSGQLNFIGTAAVMFQASFDLR